MTTARLVLSGGAALGIAQIGVLKVIQEFFDITGVIGTSIGAVIGGLYAKGMSPDEILEITSQYKKRDIFNPFNLDKKLSGIFDGKMILKLFETWTDGVMIENCRLPFNAVSYDLNKCKTVLIDKGLLAKAMRASASIPYLFAPYQWGKYSFVDGGIEYPLPLGLAGSLPGEVTIAVNVLPNTFQKTETILLDNLKYEPAKLRLNEVFLRSVTQNQAYMAMQSILDNKPDIVIDTWYPEGSFFGFDEAETFYHYGVAAARKAMDEYEQPNYLDKIYKNYETIMSRLHKGIQRNVFNK